MASAFLRSRLEVERGIVTFNSMLDMLHSVSESMIHSQEQSTLFTMRAITSTPVADQLEMQNFNQVNSVMANATQYLFRDRLEVELRTPVENWIHSAESTLDALHHTDEAHAVYIEKKDEESRTLFHGRHIALERSLKTLWTRYRCLIRTQVVRMSEYHQAWIARYARALERSQDQATRAADVTKRIAQTHGIMPQLYQQLITGDPIKRFAAARLSVIAKRPEDVKIAPGPSAGIPEERAAAPLVKPMVNTTTAAPTEAPTEASAEASAIPEAPPLASNVPSAPPLPGAPPAPPLPGASPGASAKVSVATQIGAPMLGPCEKGGETVSLFWSSPEIKDLRSSGWPLWLTRFHRAHSLALPVDTRLQLQQHFAKRKTVCLTGRGPAAAAMTVTASGPLVMDGEKRAYMFNITLRSLNLDIERIQLALARVDADELGEDVCSKLQSLVPTDKELARAMALSDSKAATPSGAPDKFVLRLCRTPLLAARFNTLLFCHTFAPDAQRVGDAISCLQSAADAVLACDAWGDVLVTILLTGNFLNHGTRRAGQYGFPLRDLEKVNGVRTTTPGRQTLLTLVSRWAPTAAPTLVPLGRVAKRAACLDSAFIRATISGFSKHVSVAKRIVDASPRDDVKKLAEFVEFATLRTQQLASLMSALEARMGLVFSTLICKPEPFELTFSRISSFIELYAETHVTATLLEASPSSSAHCKANRGV